MLACLTGLSLVGGARAASLAFCDGQPTHDAVQQDRLLRFAAVIRGELDASGQRVALVARSGLDLRRFGLRYSHTGISLRDGDRTPWSVRQLYYACDAHQSRLYDQGLAGFVLGADDADLGYVWALLLPPEPAAALARTALDTRQALALLNPRYSANAYPFSLRYQNCNQWTAELLAWAWGAAPAAAQEDLGAPASSSRARAQHWLQEHRYRPTDVHAGAWLGLGAFIPWVHADDHPPEDLAQATYRVSMPASVQAFVRERWPATQRIEFCHDQRQVVVHTGWTPLGPGCQASPGDRVVSLVDPPLPAGTSAAH